MKTSRIYASDRTGQSVLSKRQSTKVRQKTARIRHKRSNRRRHRQRMAQFFETFGHTHWNKQIVYESA